MNLMSFPLASRVAAVVLLTSLTALAQRGNRTPQAPEVIRGPFHSATVMKQGRGAAPVATKGISITLGAEKNAYICYDTDTLRPALAWSGEFLNFGNALTQIQWPPPPTIRGTPVFETADGPGWAKGGSFADPRSKGQGPLPRDWARYSGLHMYGDQVVLSYTVGKVKVLELPAFESVEGQGIFTRTLNVGSALHGMSLAVCSLDDAAVPAEALNPTVVGSGRYIVVGKEKKIAVGLVGGPKKASFSADNGQLRLTVPWHFFGARFTLAMAALSDDQSLARFKTRLGSLPAAMDLASLTKGGPAKWTQTVETKGERSADDDAYVADLITEPSDNPYHAQMFIGGFDFFPDGRVAICTWHGEVWVGSGINDSLEKLTWRRYATGLFQPLGLKIVKGEIYVLGRDQISIVRDLNKDGEADFYENFNNDTIVTPNYHEFCLDLHTDSQGNFYFAKGAPWEPEVTSASQGTLIKVSKDGSKSEVIATGLRAPNGMTVGPRDEITVSDNQGHWMPASKLNWIEKGGFYGMVPTAHRPLTWTRGGTNFTANPSDPAELEHYRFRTWNRNARDASALQPVENYDEPIAWLPTSMDNSSGGQVWATSKNWGPLQDKLLFMSYGKCTLFEVMLDEVDGTRQAAMVQFPLKFASGLMRGRVNPIDGQVYVAGLKGWQNTATRNGALYRVRYTGKPARMPVAFHAASNGVKVDFSTALGKAAADPENYSVELWNYKWTGSYGSPEFSVANPENVRHDRLDVKAARLSADGRSLFLEIEGLKPADQIKVKYSVEDAGGTTLAQEIYGTIHKLGPAM